MSDSPVTITSRQGRHAAAWVVEVKGPLTLANIFSFQEKTAFLKAHELVRVLIIDLTGTPYMDSAGLGCLINLYVSAEKHEQKFYLAGANDRLAALFETAKVHRLIRMYPTVADVEASLGEGKSGH